MWVVQNVEHTIPSDLVKSGPNQFLSAEKHQMSENTNIFALILYAHSCPQMSNKILPRGTGRITFTSLHWVNSQVT